MKFLVFPMIDCFPKDWRQPPLNIVPFFSRGVEANLKILFFPMIDCFPKDWGQPPLNYMESPVFPPAPVANGVGVCANGVLQNTSGGREIDSLFLFLRAVFRKLRG